MKKIMCVFIAFIITSLSLQAQTSFGIKGGVNSNTFYLKSEGTMSDSRYSLTKPGFHVGGLADIGISEEFSLQPQLLLAMKGGKIQIDETETDFTFYTIDVPINLVYHYSGFFIGAGPNLSYGVSGKGKTSNSSTKIDLYKDDALGPDSKFKRFDVGINATMGYRCPGGLIISTNFTPGLTDIYAESSASTGTVKAQNSFWGFSIGYFFGSATATKKK